MSSVTDLGEIVGKSLTDDVAGKIALRAAKVAALGVEHAFPSQQGGLGVVDLNNPLFHGDGYDTKLLAAKSYTKAPELFYGPFMQLGTYLKGKGVIQSDALALGLDVLGPDPINLATLGTAGAAGKLTGGLISGLTRTGRVAELASAVRDAHGALSGAAFVNHIADTLESAAKLANVGEEVVAKAKLGDHASALDIMRKALASGGMAEEDAKLLENLRKNSKAVADVLGHAEKIAAKGALPEEAFLGKTVGERIARGQVNPILKIAKPAIAEPWKIPLQMMGFSVKGETYWVPGAARMAGGLEKAAVSPGLSAYNATTGMAILRVMADSSHDQLLKDVGIDGFEMSDLANRFRRMRQLAPSTKVEGTAEFESFVDRFVSRYNGIRRAGDQAAVRRVNETIAEAVSTLEGLRPQLETAIGTKAIESDYAAQAGSMLRRISDQQGIRSLLKDMGEPGFGIPSRSSFARLVARESVVNIRDIIEQGYKGDLMREMVAEVFGPATAHAGLFEERGGRLFLTADDATVKKEAPFLDSIFERSRARPESEGLQAHMRDVGLDPQLTHVIKEARLTIDATGRNLISEGVVQGLTRDYFPRVFRPSEKFFKEFGGNQQEMEAAMERLFASDQGDEILKNLGAQPLTPKLDKAGQGKLSIAEMRRWTEDVARRMEAGGYGSYKKDGPELLGHYMEAAHSALLFNRVLHDLPGAGGPLTFGEMAARLGSKKAAEIPQEALRKATRVMLVDGPGDIPKELRPYFTRLDPRYRAVPAARDTEKVAALAEVGVAREQRVANPLVAAPESGAAFREGERAVTQTRKAMAQARKDVASRLSGKQYVGDILLKDRKTGKVREFDPDWLLKGKVPGTLERHMEIKAALARQVKDELKAASEKVAQRIKLGEAEARAAEAAALAGKPSGKQLFVFTPDYAHLQQALHLYGKGEGVPSWLRAYRDWNYRFKSALLMADIYHLNTLSFTQLLTNPEAMVKLLATQRGIQRAAIGGAVGASVGLASGRDAGAVAGLSLVGAAYGLALTAALERAGGASRWALNPGHVDTLYWMARGNWIGKPDDRAIGVLAGGLKAIRDRLAQDVAQGTVKPLLHPIDKIRFMAEAWEKTLWEVAHNGSKHFYFDTIWRRELPKLEASAGHSVEALTAKYEEAKKAGALPEGVNSASKYVQWAQDSQKAAMAREIVQAGNLAFGGENWANLLNHPEYQRAARDFLLSPDWTASRTAMTATYLMNMGPVSRAALGAGLGTAIDYVQAGGDPDSLHPARAAVLGAGAFLALGKWADGIQKRMMVPGDVMRKEAARMSAAALLGGFTMAQMLNKMFTGHWMFENDEGRRTQIGLGDGSYIALGKPWVEAFEFAGVYHPDKYPQPVVGRLFSKSAPIPHAVFRVMTNTNDWGGPLITEEDGPLDIAYKDVSFAIDAVAPIGLQGASRVFQSATSGQYDPRQLQAGALRTFGFQTAVPASRQQVGNLFGEPANLSDLLSGSMSGGGLLGGRF